MARNSETNADASEGNSPARRTWDVAKWLIPSVTALFVIVGYVAASGHYALLGFDPGFLGTTQYSAITAEFLGSVIDTVLGVNAWPYLVTQPRLLLATSPALLLCVLLTFFGRPSVAAKAKTESSAEPGVSVTLFRDNADRLLAFARQPTAALLALALVVLLKGALLDAPAFKVEGALVTLGDPGAPGSAPYPLQARLQKAAKEGSLGGFAASNAAVVWTELMCRRVDAQALKGSSAGLRCTDTRESYAHRIKAEFLAHLIATACVAWLAALLFARSQRVVTVSAAWLAMLYGLTLPYAYGKLVRSTEYPFGEFALKTQVDFGTGDFNRRLINGFEIIRDGGTATIATRRVVECGNAKTKSEVKLWRISLSEILWHREIYRDDILGWKLATERDDCPSNDPT